MSEKESGSSTSFGKSETVKYKPVESNNIVKKTSEGTTTSISNSKGTSITHGSYGESISISTGTSTSISETKTEAWGQSKAKKKD